jgi:hypothetical protein
MHANPKCYVAWWCSTRFGMSPPYVWMCPYLWCFFHLLVKVSHRCCDGGVRRWGGVMSSIHQARHRGAARTTYLISTIHAQENGKHTWALCHKNLLLIAPSVLSALVHSCTSNLWRMVSTKRAAELLSRRRLLRLSNPKHWCTGFSRKPRGV